MAKTVAVRSGDLAGLTKALKNGCFIHAFLSGGGLRVVRVETKKGGKLKGYGEHSSAGEALEHADEDYRAGGRPYHKVYGEKGKYAHYLTGSSSQSSDLDGWLLRGRTFDCWWNGTQFVFRLRGYVDLKHPEGMSERVLKTGRAETWTSRGYEYSSYPDVFPNGEPCVVTRIVKAPPGRDGADPWMWEITKTGRGDSIKSAMTAAFAATEVEVDPKDRTRVRPDFSKE